jgi:hypothetical protein
MEIQTPLPPVIDEESERVACQLQEQEHFEQEQHDAEVAQRFYKYNIYLNDPSEEKKPTI